MKCCNVSAAREHTRRINSNTPMHACTHGAAGAKTLFKLIHTVVLRHQRDLSAPCNIVAALNLYQSPALTSHLSGNNSDLRFFNSESLRFCELFDISQTVGWSVWLVCLAETAGVIFSLGSMVFDKVEGLPSQVHCNLSHTPDASLSLDLFWSHKYTCCSHTLMQPCWHFILLIIRLFSL